MAEQGGYRLPSEPAMQSGPGSLSQRTDGGPASKQAARYMAGGDYGDGGLMDIQTSAPMAATPDVKAAAPSEVAQAAMAPEMPQVTPLTAPSARPYEPVTTGVDIGPGAGSEVLPTRAQVQGQYQNAYEMFNQLASNPNASPAMKYLAQRVGQVF
jgi:hypothetical protein